jgi:hypothetical protein
VVNTIKKVEKSTASKPKTASTAKQPKAATKRTDEKCQVFDHDDLLIGHMTVKAAEEMAAKVLQFFFHVL